MHFENRIVDKYLKVIDNCVQSFYCVIKTIVHRVLYISPLALFDIHAIIYTNLLCEKVFPDMFGLLSEIGELNENLREYISRQKRSECEAINAQFSAAQHESRSYRTPIANVADEVVDPHASIPRNTRSTSKR